MPRVCQVLVGGIGQAPDPGDRVGGAGGREGLACGHRAGGAAANPSVAVELFWIPLGAGAHVVRLSGRVFEALSALVQRRPRWALSHSALVTTLPDGRYVVELAPVIDADGRARGVVVGGPVGLRWLGRFRVLRYEVRCWAGGEIPDLDHAVADPVPVGDGEVMACGLLDLAVNVPAPVW